MQIGIANGIPLNATVTGDDLIPAYDQASGTEGYVNLSNAVQSAFKGSGAGTANGVLYLDGNRTATSGSGLVFNGANLGIGTSSPGAKLEAASTTDGDTIRISFPSAATGTTGGGIQFHAYTNTAALVEQGRIQTICTNGSAAYGGAMRFMTAGSGGLLERMRLDENGDLLVGTTATSNSPYQGVNLMMNSTVGNVAIGHANGTATGNAYVTMAYAGTAIGSITQSGTTAVAYNTSSDYRLKDNQAPLIDSGAFIDALKPKTWTWKADGSKGVGFIAHEVQEVSPTSVVGEKDAMRVEQYEVSPAVPATYDEQGNELTPAVEAVMGEREVPAYQAMEYGSAEFIANIVAELQSLRKRVAVLEAR